jgi:colanic acid/amylovoran biosynthesis glycosyltransferase
MKYKNNTIGSGSTVLQLVSASAVNPSTFVLREVRELRRMGFEVVLGQLRPLYKQMSANGFEELVSLVVRPLLWPPTILFAIAYFSFRRPRQLWGYLSLIFLGEAQFKNIAKMLYILLVAVAFSYRCRGYESVHVRGHFLHTEALAAHFVSGLLQAPYSITVHTVVVHFPPKVVDEVVRRASFVVADTLQVQQFLERLGVPSEHIRLIRNGLPLDDLKFRADRQRTDPPILLAAGYLVPKKGFDVLLSACGILLRRGIQFRCVIVGDGAERAKLEGLLRELGLQREVEMVGDVAFAELKEWYYRATIFIMPSVRLSDGATDGLPTVVIESLACGTPVIGTTTAAIPEVILHGKTGLLVPPNEPSAMADQILTLLSQEGLRSSLAHEGRRLIEKNFNVLRNSETLARLILEPSRIPQGFALNELSPELS